jgi:hypothetical protein
VRSGRAGRRRYRHARACSLCRHRHGAGGAAFTSPPAVSLNQ